MSPARGKTILALAVLLLASGWGWHRQHGLSRQRADLGAALVQVERRLVAQNAASERLEALRNDAATERAERDLARAAVATTARELTLGQADARWVQPPAGAPNWSPDSPYVWLSKPVLGPLRVVAFGSDGALTDEFCALLDVQPEARETIGRVLGSVLAEWRDTEAAGAVRSDQHLYQMRTGKGLGAPVTVQVPPQLELAARLRGRVEGVVRETLGDQRGQLFERWAETKLNGEFGPPESRGGEPTPKVYSIQRVGEKFNIAWQTADSSGNTSAEDWRTMIPERLQPLMAEGLDAPGPPRIDPNGPE